MRFEACPRILVVGLFGLTLALAQDCQGQEKFVQVELTRAVKTKKAKVGDLVTAQTVTPLILANGTAVPVGSKVLGHVRRVEAEAVDTHSSWLAISFEQVEVKTGQTLLLKLIIQAAMAAQPTGATQQSNGVASPSGGVLPDHPLQGHASSLGGVGGGDTAELAQDSVTGRSGKGSTEPKEKAAHTGSVVGVPGVNLQVADAAPYASTFQSSKKNLQLDSGLQLMLLVIQ